jgi:PKD repeat protein
MQLKITPVFLVLLIAFYSTRLFGADAPITFAPAITVMATGPVAVPITVNGFTGVGSMTLSLEYDPSTMSYVSFVKNPAFGSSFLVGNNPGASGKMIILMQWFGTPVTLANGATLCTLNFNYTAASSNGTLLTWFDNGPSCQYTDANTAVLNDVPGNYFYHNGSVAPSLVANFSADKLSPAKTDTVKFTDLSAGGATSWTWSFDKPGVIFLDGTSNHSQNPHVKFSDGGYYSVTLAISNSYFNNSVVKSGYILVGLPGLWLGTASAEWNNGLNWDNSLVPGSVTEVVIPSSALNWPVFNGNLTIGIQCSRLTLSGTTSRLTITGNLIIP